MCVCLQAVCSPHRIVPAPQRYEGFVPTLCWSNLLLKSQHIIHGNPTIPATRIYLSTQISCAGGRAVSSPPKEVTARATSRPFLPARGCQRLIFQLRPKAKSATRRETRCMAGKQLSGRRYSWMDRARRKKAGDSKFDERSAAARGKGITTTSIYISPGDQSLCWVCLLRAQHMISLWVQPARSPLFTFDHTRKARS